LKLILEMMTRDIALMKTTTGEQFLQQE